MAAFALITPSKVRLGDCATGRPNWPLDLPRRDGNIGPIFTFDLPSARVATLGWLNRPHSTGKGCGTVLATRAQAAAGLESIRPGA